MARDPYTELAIILRPVRRRLAEQAKADSGRITETKEENDGRTG